MIILDSAQLIETKLIEERVSTAQEEMGQE